MDIMKCFLSKGHSSSLSGGLYPIYNHTDCTLALYLKNDILTKSICLISVNKISSNFIVQLNTNQYLLAAIKRNPMECRCPGNTENNINLLLLARINLPRGCTILSTDLIIPAVNSFSSKLPILLWGYQCYPFISKSDPFIPINFKIMSHFGLNNLTQRNSDIILNKLPHITDVPIVIFMDTLKHIDNKYSNNFPLWLIMVNTICSIIVIMDSYYRCTHCQFHGYSEAHWQWVQQ